MTSRWAKNANSRTLREQWVEACEEARSMLDSASKLQTLRQRKERQASEGEVESQPVARQRAVPKRTAKAAAVGGFKVVGRRV